MQLRSVVFSSIPYFLTLSLWVPMGAQSIEGPVNLRAPSVSADGHRIYYAAVRRPDARPDDATNLNEWRMTASSPEITKLTNFDSDGAFAGVTSVHYPGMGERLVYTA